MQGQVMAVAGGAPRNFAHIQYETQRTQKAFENGQECIASFMKIGGYLFIWADAKMNCLTCQKTSMK